MSFNNGNPKQIETFLWQKKLAKEGFNELDTESKHHVIEKKRQEALIELEKVKQRRKEREQEMILIQNERDETTRKKENENYEQYMSKEKDFEFSQAKERSRIRIKNGRHQPIDLLASFIHEDILEENGNTGEDIVSKIKMIEPIQLVNELKLKDLEDLQHDINFYIKFDEDECNLGFWKDLLLVVEEQINDKINNNKIVYNKSRSSRNAAEHLNQKTTVGDIDKILNGKTIDQLKILQEQLVEKTTNLQKSNVDTSYWDSVHHRLHVRIAALNTTTRYKNITKERLIKKHTKNNEKKLNMMEELNLSQFETKEIYKSNTEVDRELYDTECYSPILHSNTMLDPYFDIVDADKYYNELTQQQDYIINGSKIADDKISTRLYNEECTKKMDEDEEEFTQETIDQNQDSNRVVTHYKLVKPKYFNKINTGFEWNKYNQTHYDVDNPPPKIIQGYKFNIFYPNLLDQTQTPSYLVTNCHDNPDYNIIKFSGGPPYEDIAFKIVNSEWDVGDRSNFLCQFDNGVFQLWFQFRRYKYRR